MLKVLHRKVLTLENEKIEYVRNVTEEMNILRSLITKLMANCVKNTNNNNNTTKTSTNRITDEGTKV